MKKYVLRVENPETVMRWIVAETVSHGTLRNAYYDFVGSLVDALKLCMREPADITLHSYADLAATKLHLLDPAVSYLNLDSQDSYGIPLGVSRQFDFMTGTQIGITSRPGWEDLPRQIDAIERPDNKKLGIVEDDIFTGGTLKHMIAFLSERDINIETIVSGVSSTKTINGIPVHSALYIEPEQLLELTDPRDYIFGALNGGLVVTHMQQKTRVPYCAPFTDVGQRSSISVSKTKVFSQMVAEANITLHSTLQTLNIPAKMLYPERVLEAIHMNEIFSVGDLLKRIAHG